MLGAPSVRPCVDSIRKSVPPRNRPEGQPTTCTGGLPARLAQAGIASASRCVLARPVIPSNARDPSLPSPNCNNLQRRLYAAIRLPELRRAAPIRIVTASCLAFSVTPTEEPALFAGIVAPSLGLESSLRRCHPDPRAPVFSQPEADGSAFTRCSSLVRRMPTERRSVRRIQSATYLDGELPPHPDLHASILLSAFRSIV